MAVIGDLSIQAAQMLVVIALAPLLTGLVRKAKARLLRRRGPSVIQPYRDLARLLRKEVIVADSASWLFRVAPYLIFACTWVAAASAAVVSGHRATPPGGGSKDAAVTAWSCPNDAASLLTWSTRLAVAVVHVQ